MWLAHPQALITLLALTLLLAGLPLAWWWRQQRGAAWPQRLAALTALTAVLTFDLIVFGAFTRLTDSGLGCPDWPGCYGQASPLHATGPIALAQAVLPDGPVTWAKAWIEMVHRYLAMAVGALILLAAVLGWRHRRALPHSPWWPALTLAWVIAQGLFGRYTVTLKLYPAIVTGHLLGALGLLVLLIVQRESFRAHPLPLPGVPRGLLLAGALLLGLQVALGGWVSTNYAVLACQGFPTCTGQWWPQGDWAQGFTLLRPLGEDGTGQALRFDALVAIHWAHRLVALAAVSVLALLAWRLWRSGSGRRHGLALAALLALQACSGVSNVVLGWPIAAALLHSAGAAALVALTASLCLRWRAAPRLRLVSLNPDTSAARRLTA